MMDSAGHLASAAGGDFPVARCEACARDVLAYRDLEVGADMVRYRCLHCDGALDALAVSFAPLDALEEHGYGVVGNDAKKGGCAESGACSLSGKKVSGPGEGGCHDGDCTHAHKPNASLPVLTGE